MLDVFTLNTSRSDPIDIDQLMRIMALTGTPSAELLVKLGSDEVPPVHLAISTLVVVFINCMGRARI